MPMLSRHRRSEDGSGWQPNDSRALTIASSEATAPFIPARLRFVPLQRVPVQLPRADAHDLFELVDKDFAIADAAGIGGFD